MNPILNALEPLIAEFDDIAELAQHKDRIAADAPVYAESLVRLGDSTLGIARDAQSKFLFELAARRDRLNGDFAGDVDDSAGPAVKQCPFSHANALALRAHLPWTAPVSLRDRQTTFGCGDRLGLATAGHIRTLRNYQVGPVLAQQSTRELTLTKRNIEGVVDDVTFLVFQEGFTDGYGADGDHLKTIADIDVAIDAGMAMITLDLTEVLNPDAEKWSKTQVDQAFTNLPTDVRHRITDAYADATFTIDDETISISALESRRCAIIYLDALNFAKEVYEHIRRRRGNEFDLELSIDETTAPTLPSHHLFIISELTHRGVELTSLAPRFIGDFQKGIDYIGDVNEFEAQFKTHCAIARNHGNYKISVHSGSDKFSVFPIVGKHTNCRFHLKTAGTSWLEAVRVIAKVEPDLYRDIHRSAQAGFQDALKLYHITADFGSIPTLDSVADDRLPDYLDKDESRQLIHISYGTVLNDPAVRPRFFAAMHRHEDQYFECLEQHFRRHADLLGIPKRDA